MNEQCLYITLCDQIDDSLKICDNDWITAL
jgi:hypothetical protein